MNKKNKKLATILIIILIVFVLIMFIVFGISAFRKEKERLYIVVDNNAMWIYKNNKWATISKDDAKSYNWTAFDVYEGNSFSGRDYLMYTNNKWYIFDNAKKAVIPKDQVLAIGGNINVSVLDFSTTNIDSNDDVYINSILKRYDISDTKNFTTKEKISLDFDGDGKYEDLFILSNIFPSYFIPSISYNLIFLRDDNATYIVYKNISKYSDDYSGCKAYVNNIIDINNDKNYEILIGCGYYSVQGVYHALYTFKDNKYQLLISNR